VVTLALQDLRSLAHLATGQIGRVAEDYVEHRLDIGGSPRDVMRLAVQLIAADPTRGDTRSPLAAWRALLEAGRALAHHTPAADARQVRFHYDVSDDFYALWLDPRRVYSCAYFRDAGMTLAQAQEAKLDHICRKLMLREGERFLDIGAGWGGLLLWAAERYGVRAHGITLSRNQHAHVNRLIEARGLRARVRMELLDYRVLPEDEPYDKIASVGMFEHVGLRRAPEYFRKISQLLRPKGLFLNHAIARPEGVSDDAASLFVRKRIFPGGELIHLHETIRAAEQAGFEVLDVENLRPHYARTCRLWEQRLAAERDAALGLVDEATFRAWRIWLAASSLSFEEGFNSIYQVLMAWRGQARANWTREYIYRPED
jgi:cyclopropane-fatty-acyl-phospholipid synthase